MAENIHMKLTLQLKVKLNPKQLQTATPLQVLTDWRTGILTHFLAVSGATRWALELGTGLDNIHARLFIYKSIKIESFLNAKQQAIPIVRERRWEEGNKLFKNILYLFKCTPDIIHIVHYTAMKSSASTTASSTSIWYACCPNLDLNQTNTNRTRTQTSIQWGGIQ